MNEQNAHRTKIGGYEDTLHAETLDDIQHGEHGFKYRLLDGLPVSPFTTHDRYQLSRTLQTRQGDVCYVSFPRSGSTWLSYILFLIINQGEVPTGRVLRDDIHWVTTSWPYPRSREELDALPSPRIFKNHMPYHMALGGDPAKNPCKYVYIARNPKDVVVSYYSFESGQAWTGGYSGPWEHWLEMFVAGKLQRGDWFNHVLGWWEHRDMDNILFLKYEMLKSEFDVELKKIADFLEYPLSPELAQKIKTQTVFSRMRRDKFSNMNEAFDPESFFRKGVTGSWKNTFTVAQNEQFDALYAERMQGSGLTFDMD